MIISVLLSSTKTRSHSKTPISCVHGFGLRALKAILMVHRSDNMSNEDFRRRKRLAEHRTQAIVHWFANVLRRPDHNPTRIIYNFDPPYTNWRRPRSLWKDVVCHDFQLINLSMERLVAISVASRYLKDTSVTEIVLTVILLTKMRTSQKTSQPIRTKRVT